MIVGIVGSEAAKFTRQTEAMARTAIRELLKSYPAGAVSGACHLGGVDQWAKQEAELLGLPFTEFAPKVRTWADGYKPRNIQIATAADVVFCITVKYLPPGYKGMRFPLCYHCRTDAHVKSGGCWTVNYARQLGKAGGIIVIEQP